MRLLNHPNVIELKGLASWLESPCFILLLCRLLSHFTDWRIHYCSSERRAVPPQHCHAILSLVRRSHAASLQKAQIASASSVHQADCLSGLSHLYMYCFFIFSSLLVWNRSSRCFEDWPTCIRCLLFIETLSRTTCCWTQSS